MEPSPQQHESPGKAAAKDKPVEPGSIARFKSLAKRLFAVDQKKFLEELERDKAERAAKRGR